MKAYLEKINKEWLDDFVYLTKYPLESIGFEIVPFDGDDLVRGIKKYEFEYSDILIGSVECSNFFFEQLGITPPQYIGYPDELKEFYKRNIEIVKVKDLDNNYPYFIKPYKDVKLFTGDVIENDKLFKLFTTYYDNVTEDTLLFKSEKINIKSEWRCFIHKDILKGIQFYKGDFTIFPDVNIIKDIIGKYKDSPIAYTIDVGINEFDETFIVELNDMWAIGSYGLNRDIYTRMCLDRMNEIKKLIKK